MRSRQRLDRVKIDTLCSTLRNEVIQRTPQERFDACMNNVRTVHRRRKARRHDIISGKDFLLPLLRFLLGEKVKDNSSTETLKLRLATSCSRRRFSELKKALITATIATS